MKKRWEENVRVVVRRATICSLCVLFLFTVRSVYAGDEPRFYRGYNLNGPAVTIDGHQWEGKQTADVVCRDSAFVNQDVTLIPTTDSERAKMIRSSRWGGKVHIEIKNIPNGQYTLFCYVWEDNSTETYAVSVNGQQVVGGYVSGATGQWRKLGPFYTKSEKGQVSLSSEGGAANFSGIELWHGKYDGIVKLTSDELAFFENRIRPVLVKHCYACHSTESNELQGGLLVDSGPTLLRGGASGSAVVPGSPAKSLLIQAVRYEDGLEMPPESRLSSKEIADLEQWVTMGAPDPRRDATRFVRKQLDVEEARKFWSLRPISEPVVPKVRDTSWSKNEIDLFILAALEKQKMQPVNDADKVTLIRRATYDLIGLPPTPEEIHAFQADRTPNAFEKVVDRLLASPHYGERWGQHWMDLVRYADTAGDNSDFPIPQAYLYRNYIIDSFNSDKPYDQFLQEQIAGDLLPHDSEAQQNEQIIATGYLAISRRFGSVVKNYPQHLTIEDSLDNLGRTILGFTITCARCHDHKFDPITQDDYYGLFGIFNSSRYPFPGIELDKKPKDFVQLIDHGPPGEQLAYAMAEGNIGDAHLHQRGDPEKLGDVIPRKFLEVLGGEQLSGKETRSSGRLELAKWLTDRDNPLTPRVMVNRIWKYHFGAGIVQTPSDFGHRGLAPTHPELLDWLAMRFVKNDLSIKHMHRLLMLSRTYQLSSLTEGETRQLEKDPSNDLYWRFNRQRLDAEELRDTLLMLSGELETEMVRTPHPFPPAEKWEYTQHHPFRDAYDSNHRSVYLMTARLNARPYFTTFDGADSNACTATRDSSVTTVQSLYLLNDEYVHGRAEKFAERILKLKPEKSRITKAFELTIGRPPDKQEEQAALAWMQKIREALQTSGISAKDLDHAQWNSFARVLFRLNEFLYLD